MAMARVSSGLAYPERFYAAASYVGFDGSSDSPAKGVTSKFSNDAALLLYALYQQATVGPCKIPKPRSWSPVEQSKWTRFVFLFFSFRLWFAYYLKPGNVI
ncbi:acyl-CoA-binding domain-containing protein 4-like [Capsicum annuum]|uniref:acyl-CoA-binding domain-containing protein 4-like n=1 Tax=Capsicum annuum TaxID=4072 RepID=UPI001FB154A2|nr:acyl-CoA-binding domain-containing protein 4-like [Capsicum annuum]